MRRFEQEFVCLLRSHFLQGLVSKHVFQFAYWLALPGTYLRGTVVI